MKHIKTYENYNEKPKVGDYILANIKNSIPIAHYGEYQEFINNSIGKIIEISYDHSEKEYYLTVKYENIPKNIEFLFHSYLEAGNISYNGERITTSIFMNDIVFYSNNKEEVQKILDAKKYNL